MERLITDALNADAMADAALANDSMLWLTFMPGGLRDRALWLPPMLTPKSLLLFELPGLPLCLLLLLLLLGGSDDVASGLRGLPGAALPAAAGPGATPEKETDRPLLPLPDLLLRPLLAASALLALLGAVLAAVASVVTISLSRLTRNQPLPPVCKHSRAHMSVPVRVTN